MSDIGDLFKDFREASKLKRARNRESSAQALRRQGVPFESKNEGAHLIVTLGDHVADLWPGTGKWIVRARSEYPAKHGRGVFQLIQCLRRLNTNCGEKK